MSVTRLIPPIPLGSPIPFEVSFLDANGIPFDPDAVEIRVNDPNGIPTSYTYPDFLVKAGVGVYTITVSGSVKGKWSARGIGTLPDNSTVTTFDIVQTVEDTNVL